MRLKTILILAALLIPSALLLWSFRDIPRFGEMHDDGLYFVSAQSLADGGGYRIPSLPGEPPQTKYPPVYPLLLSVAWRAIPDFPANLPLAALLSWLALPVILMELAYIFPRFGFSQGRVILLLALFALNPYVMLFSTQLLSELWFLAFVLASMLFVEKALAEQETFEPARAVQWMIVAGLTAGLAYLTRSAGLALLAATVVYLVVRREKKLAATFAVSMLPCIVGWMLWTRAHQTPTNDVALVYYLDYFGYHIRNFAWSDAHLLLWKNADGLMWSLGGLILPKVGGSLFLKILSQVIAVAMISGVVRLLRSKQTGATTLAFLGEGVTSFYAGFAIFSSALLLVWNFPPTERFLLPVFPLALAGLLAEAEHFAGLLRSARHHKARDQRIAAGAMTAFASLLVAGAIGMQVYVRAIFLPEDAASHRQSRSERLTAYRWIRDNTPPDATLFSSQDPVVYLYTGRHAMRRQLPPPLWYRDDHPAMVDWLSDVAPYAATHGLSYFDFTGIGAEQGVSEEDQAAIDEAVASDPALAPLFETSGGTIYRFRSHRAAASVPK